MGLEFPCELSTSSLNRAKLLTAGPDTTDNGLACCSIHHHAFDRGGITISDQLRILVSSRLHGSGRLEDLFGKPHDSPLPAPTVKTALPNREFLAWHRAEVFRPAQSALGLPSGKRRISPPHHGRSTRMADEAKLGKPWLAAELDEIVADYFSMLSAELSRQPYSKSAHSKALMARIGRTNRSVEFKHQNISAVLDELGLPWIRGYIPKRIIKARFSKLSSGT